MVLGVGSDELLCSRGTCGAAVLAASPSDEGDASVALGAPDASGPSAPGGAGSGNPDPDAPLAGEGRPPADFGGAPAVGDEAGASREDEGERPSAMAGGMAGAEGASGGAGPGSEPTGAGGGSGAGGSEPLDGVGGSRETGLGGSEESGGDGPGGNGSGGSDSGGSDSGGNGSGGSDSGGNGSGGSDSGGSAGESPDAQPPATGVCAGLGAGDVVCEAAQRVSCGPGGETLQVDSCLTEAHCQAGIGPNCATCLPGEASCDDDALVFCNAEGTALSTLSCATAALCNAIDVRCDDPACAAGERRCQGAALQTCNADRNGFDLVSTCDATTGCNAELGLCNVCVPDRARCIDRRTVGVCDALGQSEVTSNCGALRACVNGACTLLGLPL